jgi:hypothetical protein
MFECVCEGRQLQCVSWSIEAVGRLRSYTAVAHELVGLVGTHMSNRQRVSGQADGGAAHRDPRCHCLRRRRHCRHADALTTTTTTTQKFLQTAQPPRCASAGCSVRGCPSSPLCQTRGETPALVDAAGASSSLTVARQLNFGPERTHHHQGRSKTVWCSQHKSFN